MLVSLVIRRRIKLNRQLSLQVEKTSATSRGHNKTNSNIHYLESFFLTLPETLAQSITLNYRFKIAPFWKPQMTLGKTSTET